MALKFDKPKIESDPLQKIFIALAKQAYDLYQSGEFTKDGAIKIALNNCGDFSRQEKKQNWGSYYNRLKKLLNEKIRIEKNNAPSKIVTEAMIKDAHRKKLQDQQRSGEDLEKL